MLYKNVSWVYFGVSRIYCRTVRLVVLHDFTAHELGVRHYRVSLILLIFLIESIFLNVNHDFLSLEKQIVKVSLILNTEMLLCYNNSISL